jgi:hypothetical protein
VISTCLQAWTVVQLWPLLTITWSVLSAGSTEWLTFLHTLHMERACKGFVEWIDGQLEVLVSRNFL